VLDNSAGLLDISDDKCRFSKSSQTSSSDGKETEGQRLDGPDFKAIYDLIIGKNPKAYPVLLRSIESRTFSLSNISSNSIFVQTPGMLPISLS
jgi:hypothetical protein